MKKWLNKIIGTLTGDEGKDEAIAPLQDAKDAFNGAGSDIVAKEITQTTEPLPKDEGEPKQLVGAFEESAVVPAAEVQISPALAKKTDVKLQERGIIPDPEVKTSGTLAEKDGMGPKEDPLTPLEIIAKIFAAISVSNKAEDTLERAMDGSDQAKKDLWFFINNKKEGVPENKVLWAAGFGLLKEAAANGNKQAISDLAYVEGRSTAVAAKGTAPEEDTRTPLEIVAELFAKNNVSDKAQDTLERAMDGSDQAKKDLWFFINNKKEGVPENKELWAAGFNLLKESAANGNKQAISDLAYVEARGIKGISIDQDNAEVIVDTKDRGIKSTTEIMPQLMISETFTEKATEPEEDERVSLARKIEEGTLDPELAQCAFSTAGDGVIISCQLKDALLAQGVDPENCTVELVNDTGTKNPGYVVTVNEEQPTQFALNP